MIEAEFQKQLLQNLRSNGCVAHKFGDAPRTFGQAEVRFTSIKYYDMYTLIPPKYTELQKGLYVGIEVKRYFPKQMKTKVQSFSLSGVRAHQITYLQDVHNCDCPALLLVYVDNRRISKEDRAYMIPVTEFTVEDKQVFWKNKKSMEYTDVISYTELPRKLSPNGIPYKTKWDLANLLNINQWYEMGG